MCTQIERCKMYSDSKISIRKLLVKECDIDENVIKNQLILIKNDLVTSREEAVKNAALDMLKFLINNVVSTVLEIEVIKLVNDKNINSSVKTTIISCMKKAIVKSISNGTFNITKYLTLWRNQNILKLINIIEELCRDELSKETCKKIFLNSIIPEVMNINTNNEIRNVLLDISYKLLPIVPSSELTTAEFQEFVASVTTIYVKSITDLREQDYENWHRMWILLVRFCGSAMHNIMDLTNRLLRIVEYAFRNQSCHQRIKGYDCWKELIDNASLNPQYISSIKQIKLLITPLKAKFSKQEQVIVKRFEVFVYLLQKLKGKASLCLTEFLEFCFGAVTENSDPHKTGQGKTIQLLWQKNISILLEILGHKDNCLETQFVFEAPIINEDNIDSFCKVIFKCINECCLLLKDSMFDENRDKIIQCLWKSLFNIINNTTEEKRENCLSILVSMIMNNLKDKEDLYIQQSILSNIFYVIMSKDMAFTKSLFLSASAVFVPFIFSNNYIGSYDQKNFQSLVTHCLLNKDVFNEFLCNFETSKSCTDINLVLACDSWIAFSNYVLLDVHDFEKIKFLNYLLWPVQYYHLIKEGKMKDIKNSWVKVYQKITGDSENHKISILRELEKLFKSNPLLISNIIVTMRLITQFEKTFNKAFVAKILDLTSRCLELPTLKKHDEQKLSLLIEEYLNSSLAVYNEDDNEEAISKICVCIEHILKVHKNFDILESFLNLLNNVQLRLKSIFSKFFSKLLFDLYSDQTDFNNPIAMNLQKIMLVLDLNRPDAPKTPKFSVPRTNKITPTGRSAKIANLLKTTPSPKAIVKKETPPSILRLFGKNVDTMTPIQVKGSQLNNTPVRAKKMVTKARGSPKEKAIPSIDDESTSKFVAIDTEIKFRPEKLNDHQKEILQRRREDIPALYQDLSQSQSQDIFNMKNSNSSSNLSIVNSDKQKTINEFVEIDVNVNEDIEGVNNTIKVLPTTKVEEVSENVKNYIDSVSKLEEKPSGIVDLTDVDVNLESISSHEESKETSVETGMSNEEKSTIIETNIEVVKENVVPVPNSSSIENTPVIPDNQQELESNQQQGKKREKKLNDAEFNEKKRLKIEAELKRLKMDIVASDQFLLSSPRRSRSSISKDILKPKQGKQKPQEEEKPSKTPSPNRSRRKQISPDEDNTKKVFTPKLNNRKSMTVVEEQIKKEIPAIKAKRKSINVVDDSIKRTDRTRSSGPVLEIKYEDVFKGRGKSRKSVNKNEGKSKVVDSALENKPEISNDNSRKIEEPQKDSKLVDNIIQEEENETKSCDIHSDENNDTETINKEIEEFTLQGNEYEKIKENETNINEVPVENNGKISIESKKRKLRENEVEYEEDIGSDCDQNDIESDKNKMLFDPKKRKLSLNEKENVINEVHDEDIKSDNKFSEVDPCTEDIIESSQEVSVCITPICSPRVSSLNLKKPKVFASIDINEECEIVTLNGEHFSDKEKLEDTNLSMLKITEDQNVIQETPLEVTQQNLNVTQNDEPATVDVSLADTVTQTESDPCDSSNAHYLKPVLKLDLPTKPEMTSSELLMSNMDTVSLLSDSITNDLSSNNTIKNETATAEMLGTPVSAKHILPSSPITGDTPTKTSELLKGTVNISPIRDKINSEGTNVSCISNEKLITISEEVVTSTEAHITSPVKKTEEEIPEKIPERFMRLMNGGIFESPISHRRKSGGISVSPSASRIRKLMSPFNQNKTNLQEDFNIAHEEDKVDIFKFSKDMPSLNGTPERSILKKRPSDILDDGISPCSKRKRVHFSYPTTTSQKVYLKPIDPEDMKLQLISKDQSDEVIDFRDYIHEQHESDDNSEMIYPLLKDCMHPVNNLFTKTDSSYQKLLKYNIKNIADLASRNEADIFLLPIKPPVITNVYRALDNYYNRNILKEDISEDKEDCMLEFDENNSESKSACYILYPKLIKCYDLVENLFRRMRNLDLTLWRYKLREHGIKLVCDLVQISEPKIMRMPFKGPVVTNVYKALDCYYHKTHTSEIHINDRIEFEDDTEMALDCIYPKLVDCTDNVDVILRKQSAARSQWVQKLKSSNINTVADLAKLTQHDILRLPFKEPSVFSVYRALDRYYKAINEEVKAERIADNVNDNCKALQVDIEQDPRLVFKNIMNQTSEQDTLILDLGNILFRSLSKEKVTTLLKNNNFDFKDILTDFDFGTLIRVYVKNNGIEKIFQFLSDALETSDEESVYFDCIRKYSVDKKPLITLIEKRSLEEIKSSLLKAVKKNIFIKQDILDICFIPLLNSPNDIKSYLSNLNVVQLGDAIIKYVKSKDLDIFISRLYNSYESQLLNVVDRPKMLKMCPENELTQEMTSRSLEEMMKCHSKIVNKLSLTNQNEGLVQIFTSVSRRLSQNTIREFVIQFLQDINLDNSN